jgi:hypothetical protein
MGCMGYITYLEENTKGRRDNLKCLDINDRIILKDFREMQT